MSTHFDALVLGTGQAGPSLAARLNREGLRVAVVERGAIGGSCVNVGCTPTKALVASARVAHMARRAAHFGVQLDGPVRIDMQRVHQRMQDIVGTSRRGVTSWLERMENVELVRGHARFTGPKEVDVAGRRLSGDRIFLNVGARPAIPDLPGLDQVEVSTSSDLLERTETPEHLVVLGGGPIGLELGQAFRRFGSRVTIVERGPRLMAREDPDVSSCIREIFEAEGIRVKTHARCLKVRRHGEGVALRIACNGGDQEIVGSHLLVATGRRPNTDALGLDAAGIATDERGYVVVDDTLETNVAGVYALGDVNGKGAFTHTSYNDYEIVAANLFDGERRRVSDRIPVHGLFIDPPLGRVGMTEAQALASGRRVLIGKYPMSNVGRAKERSETDGFLKVLVDGDTDRVLGAAVLGIRGDEVVHTLLVLMAADAPYTVLSRAVLVHPTVSELLPTTLQNLVPLEEPLEAAS